MLFRRHFSPLGIALTMALLVSGVALTWLVIDRMVLGPGFQWRVERTASRFLKHPVTVEKLQWRRWKPQIFIGRNVRIWEDPSKQRLLAESPVVVVRRQDGAYTMDRAQFQGLGGTITIQGSYLPSASTDGLKIIWKTMGVQAQELFLLVGSSVEVSGILDSDGHLQSGVGSRFLPSLNGEVKLNLQKGWFGNATGLLKVFSKLNLTTLVTEAAGKHRSRVPFDEAHGTIKITDGKASSEEPLVLENKTLQMAFMGTYDLTHDSLDGKVVVNVLTITDEIIHLIPGVRDILLGQEKSLIPIWLEVQGPAANPRIRILSGKSIASPFWNTIAHVFRLPEKLIKKAAGK